MLLQDFQKVRTCLWKSTEKCQLLVTVTFWNLAVRNTLDKKTWRFRRGRWHCGFQDSSWTCVNSCRRASRSLLVHWPENPRGMRTGQFAPFDTWGIYCTQHKHLSSSIYIVIRLCTLHFCQVPQNACIFFLYRRVSNSFNVCRRGHVPPVQVKIACGGKLKARKGVIVPDIAPRFGWNLVDWERSRQFVFAWEVLSCSC